MRHPRDLELVVREKSQDELPQLLNDVVARLKKKQVAEDGKLNVAEQSGAGVPRAQL